MQSDRFECEYYCPRCEGTWMNTCIRRAQFSNCPKCGYRRHPYRMTVWSSTKSYISIRNTKMPFNWVNRFTIRSVFVFLVSWFRFTHFQHGLRINKSQINVIILVADTQKMDSLAFLFSLNWCVIKIMWKKNHE